MLVLFLFAFQNGFFVAGHPRTTTCGKIPASLGGSPMDEAALHVENLREALRQTQRHIVTAIGASASLVFLERGIASVSEGGMTIPPLGVGVALSATAIYLSAT